MSPRREFKPETFRTAKRTPPGFVANRVEALHAYLRNEPDSHQWLEATGLTRPFTREAETGTWGPCNCPFCEGRDIDHPTDATDIGLSTARPLKTRKPRPPKRGSRNV